MLEQALAYLTDVPTFLSYFGLAVLLTVLFVVIYTALTPHSEWSLIKDNKPAAALAFGGGLVGFVLPLASAIAHSINLLDCLVWGLVACAVQLATFFGLRLVIRDLPGRIARDEIASGIFVAFAAIAAGLLNAASLSY
ncbi:MAG: DUF350 domain-containing protein [Gammaproteobacteria bacterium]|nr:DUF350 domain-containing protein [Gammaproteobacteria bacterium]